MEGGPLGGSCCAVLDGEGEDVSLAGATQVEVTVTPGVQLGATSEGLSGAEVGGALAGMVDEDDGGLMVALQTTQVVEQRSHLGGDVFVDAMEADEGVEDEEGWTQDPDGVIEALAISVEVEAQGGCGDDLEVEVGQFQVGGGADAFESLSDGGEGILGGEEQDPPGSSHGETTETGGSGGDGHGHVQSEERLAA
jgi:hypothetical protein